MDVGDVVLTLIIGALVGSAITIIILDPTIHEFGDYICEHQYGENWIFIHALESRCIEESPKPVIHQINLDYREYYLVVG